MTNGNLEDAKKFASENPFLTINIKPSYLDGNHPNLSSVFARRYFTKRKQNVMIKFGNKFWSLKVICYLSRSASFCKGWTLFAKENKLEVGDVCVFELINREDIVFDLHIFRGHN
ncbi:putative transcription factor B3-Domain family [Lupinus albus]|uniref:Putative transcription factor B3-Domain family n=1 Tax=Lupinus albus TaxID=3870 RepID=A0A6A4PVE6_LUPAL|nr:putative transcription factor B3-Domain family [Lupinus albus]